MHTTERRVLIGLGFGIALGMGCYDGPAAGGSSSSTGGTGGPMLCMGNQVTCPDGTCQLPGPGVCCNHGGVCPTEDSGGPIETTNPVTTNNPPPPPPPPPPPETTSGASSDDTSTSNGDETTEGASSSSSGFSSSSESGSSSGGSSSSGTTGSTTDATSTTDSGSSGETSTSTSVGSESTVGLESSGESGASTTVMMLDPLAFDDAPATAAGPFGCDERMVGLAAASPCGPAAPCRVWRDTIEPRPAPRRGSPSLALDDDCRPAVLHSAGLSEPRGSFARPAEQGWDVQATALDLSDGGLRFDSQHEVFRALVHEGSFDVSARADVGAGSDDLVLDYGAWFSTVMPRGGADDPDVALTTAPGGVRHMTYRPSRGPRSTLRWESSAGAAEEVRVHGAPPLTSASGHPVVVTGSIDQPVPHILTMTGADRDGRGQLVHLRRDGDAGWTSTVLATEPPAALATCDRAPRRAGQTCALDRVRYRPLAIAAGPDGDLRWLYAEDHLEIDYVAECETACAWVPTRDLSTSRTLMGWASEGGEPMSVDLRAGVRVARADARIDRAGVLHMVAYASDAAERSGATTVEYFRISR